MTIDPSDLPPEVRRGLLDQLRSQIGDSSYRELMDKSDEDQILRILLKSAESEPARPAKPAPPGWAVFAGKILLAILFGGLAWLIGTIHPAGRAFAGAAFGILTSFWLDAPGFAFGAVVGGAVGGLFGKKLDAAAGGVFIGGWGVVLIRFALEWLAKQTASIIRYR